MHRIDTLNTTNAIPAPRDPGVAGYFRNVNPALGLGATVIDADWLNSVQEEIAGVVAGAGLALDKGDNTQLAQAIAVLVGGGIAETLGLVRKVTATSANHNVGAGDRIIILDDVNGAFDMVYARARTNEVIFYRTGNTGVEIKVKDDTGAQINTSTLSGPGSRFAVVGVDGAVYCG